MALCVGLDEFEHHLDIIDGFPKIKYAKINPAFHSQERIDTMVQKLNDKGVRIIFDCKIGDIENTQKSYLKKYENYFALTVNPYMGYDVVKPFLGSHLECFVLLLTSNGSRKDFQLDIYPKILQKIIEWHRENNKIGIVMGATIGEEHMREIVYQLFSSLGYLPKILIPGIGRQGGSINKIIDIIGDITGKKYIDRLIFSNSSEIMKDPEPNERILEQIAHLHRSHQSCDSNSPTTSVKEFV